MFIALYYCDGDAPKPNRRTDDVHAHRFRLNDPHCLDGNPIVVSTGGNSNCSCCRSKAAS